MGNSLLNILLDTKIFGIELIDSGDFFQLLWRFCFNSLVAIVIIRYIYYPSAKRRDFIFTFMLFSVVVFFLCHLLANVKIGMGFALGLFAIFGIMRYRTETVPIKEMTYLFIIIGISVINALANKKVSYAELLFTNFAMIAFTFGLEKLKMVKHEATKLVLYEKIEFLKEGKEKEMIADLRERTGLDVQRFEIIRINFMRDTAEIMIFYHQR